MMEQNIFTKPFSELTADEFLHVMDMMQEECIYYHKSCNGCRYDEVCELGIIPADFDTNTLRRVIERFMEENR